MDEIRRESRVHGGREVFGLLGEGEEMGDMGRARAFAVEL